MEFVANSATATGFRASGFGFRSGSRSVPSHPETCSCTLGDEAHFRQKRATASCAVARSCRERASLVLLLLLALHVHAAEILTIEGQWLSGEVRLEGDRLLLSTGTGETGSWSLSHVPAIRFGDAGRRTPLPPQPSSLRLANGDHLSGHTGGISPDVVALDHPYLGSLRLPRKLVRVVRLGRDAGFGPREGGTGVTMVNGDWLPCRVVSVSADHVMVDCGENSMALPRERCSRVYLVPGTELEVRPCPETALQFIRFRNGDVVSGQLARLDPKQIGLKRNDGTLWTVATDSVEETWREGPRLMPLSTVDPTLTSYTPQFDESFPVARDRDLSGRAISLSDRTYARGITCHSRTRLSYELSGRWDRFVAQPGLSDTAPPSARATFRIIVDGRKVYERNGAGGAGAPVPVSIDVRRAGTLTLIVDYGPDGSAFGDHAVWAAATLVGSE